MACPNADEYDNAIHFKAGKCDLDASTGKVKAITTQGYLLVYKDPDYEDCPRLGWRPRNTPFHPDEDLDRVMVGGEPYFRPYTGESAGSSDSVRSPTNGRIFSFKVGMNKEETPQLYWLQSQSQHPDGDANWFSPYDLKLGELVDRILNGEDLDVQAELKEARDNNGPGRPDDGDATMQDADETDRSTRRGRAASGGAGAGATGGDVRDEGEESREGGADGGRAAAAGPTTDTNALVQNFLKSFESNPMGTGGGRQQSDKPFTTLPDLLTSSVTIPVIDSADGDLIDSLVSHLPQEILLLTQGIDDAARKTNSPEVLEAYIEALEPDQKRDILRRVLRSPQMHQSLGSLTMALRGGGLPDVSKALDVKVQNEGYREGVPLGGGEAVEAFLNGVKKTVEDEDKDVKMETD